MVSSSKEGCVFMAESMSVMVVTMMPVLAVKMLCQAVIATVQKLKLNVTMMVKTYNSSTKASAKREEAGGGQKPNHRFFKYQSGQVTKP